jgi:hypothetical protein
MCKRYMSLSNFVFVLTFGAHMNFLKVGLIYVTKSKIIFPLRSVGHISGSAVTILCPS